MDGADDGERKPGLLFAIEATPGLWLGLAGLALVVVAAALPWYTIAARVPPVYPNVTTIIQFDGINGVYVEPTLKAFLGWNPPAVGFPFVLLFVVSALLKVRKLLRSTTHKMRASTLFRSSITILIPTIITIVVISQIPSFIPSDAPAEARELARAIGAQPLGGVKAFTFTVEPGPPLPPQTVQGDLHWGFGPAIWVMIGAAALMNIGSRLEMYAYKKKHKEMTESQGQG